MLLHNEETLKGLQEQVDSIISELVNPDEITLLVDRKMNLVERVLTINEYVLNNGTVGVKWLNSIMDKRITFSDVEEFCETVLSHKLNANQLNFLLITVEFIISNFSYYEMDNDTLVKQQEIRQKYMIESLETITLLK